jgi:acyl-CoA reductase-like NAD-dependent aldehyde dehydrogenase
MSDVQVHQLYIHGRYVEATSGKTFNSINPANGETIATLQQASEQDIEAAVLQRHAEGLEPRQPDLASAAVARA